MALLVLMTVGAAIGWLASIMMQQDTVRRSCTNIVIGAIGALLGYALASKKLAIDTLSPESILMGALGAMVLLAFGTLLQRRIAR